MAANPAFGPNTYLHAATGLEVHVSVGDITCFKVDALVSADDSQLTHQGGVAKAIVRKGGASVIKECEEYIRKYKTLPVANTVVTNAGHLQCQQVIHVVGPQKYDYKTAQDCAAVLKRAFDNVLAEATIYRLQSIAVPGVSAGLYAVPKSMVAKCACQSIVDVCINNKSRLKEIHLVDIDVNMVMRWQQEMERLVQVGTFLLSPTDRRTGKATGPKGTIATVKPARSIPAKPSRDFTVSKTPDDSDDFCCICMCPATNPKTLDKCQHTFCTACIDRGFKIKPACPVCGEIYGTITGDQPKDGRMTVTVDRRMALPGYDTCGTIVIDYRFPDGIQTKEHSYPGKPYKGTGRVAYLPDNKEGQKVLSLLKQAFNARLIFTVGISRTTGKQNTVTWNDIHHKTNVHGGPERFGYPDPTYLSRVKEELAAKGIK